MVINAEYKMGQINTLCFKLFKYLIPLIVQMFTKTVLQ